MKPIDFPERTAIFAEDQPPYLPLPVHLDRDGIVVCCWKLSLIERFQVLVKGRIWHRVLTFNQTLQPQHMSMSKPIMQKTTPLRDRSKSIGSIAKRIFDARDSGTFADTGKMDWPT